MHALPMHTLGGKSLFHAMTVFLTQASWTSKKNINFKLIETAS
jgi:hypothetical protein